MALDPVASLGTHGVATANHNCSKGVNETGESGAHVAMVRLLGEGQGNWVEACVSYLVGLTPAAVFHALWAWQPLRGRTEVYGFASDDNADDY